MCTHVITTTVKIWNISTTDGGFLIPVNSSGKGSVRPLGRKWALVKEGGKSYSEGLWEVVSSTRGGCDGRGPQEKKMSWELEFPLRRSSHFFLFLFYSKSYLVFCVVSPNLLQRHRLC